MAVDHDAISNSTDFSTDATFDHTPVGTPRGILVLISQPGTVNAADNILGVTYGGVAMARVNTAVEQVGGIWHRVYAYFLGSGIPTGVQQVAIDENNNETKKAVCVSLTAAEDTQVVDFDTLAGGDAVANPQIALDSGGDSALRYCIIESEHSLPSALTPVAGTTPVFEYDWGANHLFKVERQTNPSSGSFTIGYTAAASGLAMVAVAISELAPANTPPTIDEGPTATYDGRAYASSVSTPWTLEFEASDPEQSALTWELYTETGGGGTLVASGNATSGVPVEAEIEFDADGLVDGSQTLYLVVSDGIDDTEESFTFERNDGTSLVAEDFTLKRDDDPPGASTGIEANS